MPKPDCSARPRSALGGGRLRTRRRDMAHWLFKSEPGTWSWEMQKKKGDKGEEWTGVRNLQARTNMRAMKVGERGFFYHSGEGKEIVGIVEVISPAHKDSSAKEDSWECVDIKAVQDLPRPVTL